MFVFWESLARVTTYDVVMRLTAAIIQEGHWYVARCLEVEVASQGETVEEARANLTEALELYFEGDSEAEVAGPAVIASIDVAV
jgi:predicted RNase H-like HicB family nuclease